MAFVRIAMLREEMASEWTIEQVGRRPAQGPIRETRCRKNRKHALCGDGCRGVRQRVVLQSIRKTPRDPSMESTG